MKGGAKAGPSGQGKLTPIYGPAISIGMGRVSSHTKKIVDKFKEYYKHLYSSRQEEMREEVNAFFRDLAIPALSETYREKLDSLITLEELQQVTREMAGQKSPGPNGLMAQTYRR